MCGTFTQIFGQALAIGVIESFMSAKSSEPVMNMVRFLFEGVVTFYIHRWMKCTGTTRTTVKPFANLNTMAVLVGGAIGAGTLVVSASFLPKNMYGDMYYLEYVLQAILLNLMYNMSFNVVDNFATSSGYTAPTAPTSDA